MGMISDSMSNRISALLKQRTALKEAYRKYKITKKSLDGRVYGQSDEYLLEAFLELCDEVLV